MAYGQGSLTQDPRTGKYRARYWGPDGKQRCKSFGANEKTKARQFLAKQQTSKANGNWIDPRRAQVPFDKWADEWFAGKHRLSAPSRARDDSLLRNHVLPFFGKMPLGKITPLDVRYFVDELVLKGLSPRTISSTHRLFSSIMRAAIQARLLFDAPIGQGIVDLPKIERKRERILTEFQMESLARAFLQLPKPHPPYRTLVYAAAYSGCRWQELAGLKREYLDLANSELHVRGVFERVAGAVRYKEQPKSDAGRRTVALPFRLVQILDKHVKDYPYGEFVFSSPEGGLLREANFRRHWNRAIEIAGVSPLTFHDLRHTHAAWCIKQGVQPFTLQKRLGHKNIGTTYNTYGHLFPNHEKELIETLDQSWGEAESESENVVPLVVT